MQTKLKLASWLLLAFLQVNCTAKEVESSASDIKMGAQLLVESNFEALKGKNVGLVTNHSAMVGGKHLVDVLHEAKDLNLVVLFGPEHGIRGDDVGEIADAVDKKTGLPVYSLYGAIRQPTPEMLKGVDVLVFDIQDIGPRFYTYITTMGLTMQAAAAQGIKYVVLDRPNPIGGFLTEGFMLEPGNESFVGPFRIPVTHGMTVGELANMVKAEALLPGLENLDLTVIKMEGWDRNKLWTEYDLGWIKPSPNIPNFETALIYPGACFFEGLTASEGRGTQEPFVLLGAPWIDAKALTADLNSRNLPGLRFEEATFTPVPLTGMTRNPKFNGQEIYGIRYVVTDPYAVRPVEAGIHVVQAFYKNSDEANKQKFFRDSVLTRLAGTPRFQTMLQQGATAEEIIASWQTELAEFNQMRAKHLLY
jgi:uncharacterized protein YbbC (DUF1343 family)